MLIRALFPTTAHEATCETIFGVQRRPTHRNTSWERFRFEVAGDRFVDLSEPDYDAALLNGGKYGYSIEGEREHRFTCSFFPHRGNWVKGRIVPEAQALNAPLVAMPVDRKASNREGFVSVSGVDLGFGALKQAHDRTGVVLRVYEPHGIRGESTLTFDRKVKSATRVNLLEEDAGGEVSVEANSVTLGVRPFEVVSLLLGF